MNVKLLDKVDKKKQDFYFKGFTEIEIKKTIFFNNLLNEFRELQTKNLLDNSDFKQSYPNTYDLTIDAKLNEKLIKFLIHQKIPQLINKITGRDYVLGDLVLRKSYENKSYMPWHRDTYLDKEKYLVGRIPPLVKLIFYPKLEDTANHELSILPGSSRRVFRNYYFDKLQKFVSKPAKIFQSNDKCIFFDSSSIHHALPCNKNSNGSFRLIYNFCEKTQIGSFKGRRKINKIYNEFLPSLL